MKLSVVRKVLETRWFLALGSFETLGSKLSQGKFLIGVYLQSKRNPKVPFVLFPIHLDLKVKIVIDSKQFLA